MDRLHPEAFQKELQALIDEAKDPSDWDDAQYEGWRRNVYTTLTMGLGPYHPLIGEFNQAGRGSLKQVIPYIPGMSEPQEDHSPVVRANIRVLEKILRLAPSLQPEPASTKREPTADRDLGGITIAPIVTATSSSASNARATATAIAQVWNTAFAACNDLPKDQRELAQSILGELRKDLESGRRPDNLRERLGALVRLGDKFFLQVLPALLQYAEVLREYLPYA